MILYQNVNVVPMSRPAVLYNQNVLVDGNMIAYVGRDLPETVPSCRVVDGEGGYLIPGLCDMHVHLETLLDSGDYCAGITKKPSRPGVDWNAYLKIYLARGVTQVRNMSGTPEILRMRDEIEAGKREGPHIYSLSPIIDGPAPLWKTNQETTTPEESVQAVREAKRQGYDGIKVYNNLSVDQFDALLKAAEEEGLTVSGHVPIAVSLDHCLASSFCSYEHAKAITRGYLDQAAALHKVMTPTLVTQRSMDFYHDKAACERMLTLGEKRHMSPEALNTWREICGMLAGHDFRLDRTYEEYRADMCRFLHGGGILLAGTDAAFPFAIPGYSLHEELCELAAGGLSAYEALESATRVPAEFMGLADRRGTITPGKEADMVLLAANPLEDIGNTTEIRGVSFQGRWYDSDGLARLLNDADEESGKYDRQGK